MFLVELSAFPNEGWTVPGPTGMIIRVTRPAVSGISICTDASPVAPYAAGSAYVIVGYAF